MMRFILAAGAAVELLSLVVATAHAEPTAKELFEALPKQVQVEADAKRAGKLPQGVGQQDPNYLLSFYRNAREYLENGDETSAVQQLRQMEQGAATEPMREACEAVVFKIRQDHAAREAAATAELTGTLHRAGQAILAAKIPKDLDAALSDLATLSEKRVSGHGYERGNEVANTRVQTAVRFVTRWQDYLLALNRNETRQASEALRSLMSEADASQLLGVPRSEIIGHLPPVTDPVENTPRASRRTISGAEVNAAVEMALNRLKTLDDLTPVIHDLTAFRDDVLNASGNYNGNSNDFSNTLSALQSLQQSYLELQNGIDRLPLTSFNRYENQSGIHAENRLVPLRAQLIALSLPRVLGAPDSEKPGAGEKVDAFLDRLLAAAKKRGDWPAVARGVEARRVLAAGLLSEGGRADGGADDMAFKDFFAGQNYEQAGQYLQAVAAYVAALGTGSQEIPVALISQRLAEIKQVHPTEYASGNQTPSPGAFWDYSSSRRYPRPVLPVDVADAPAASPATPAPTPTPVPKPAATPAASPPPSP